MLRVSPSMLESYRLFLNEDWMTLERLIEQITSPFRETPQMALGTAVHRYIEVGAEDGEVNGHSLDCESIDAVIADLDKRSMVHEMRGYRTMRTEYGEVLISTLADGAIGNQLYEWKTTEKSLQMDRYQESVQWKLCMWALEFPAIEYRAMQMKQKDGVWTVVNWDRLPLVWSDTLMAEIQFLVTQCIGFYMEQGLGEYLAPRSLPMEVA